MRLKELRQERGLTQAQVAQAIDTSQRNISRWENEENEPTSSFIIALAQFFDISADYLLGLENDFGIKTADSERTAQIFSREEKQLVEDFRMLNPMSKKLVKQTVETLRASSGNSESGAGTESK